MLIMMRCSLLLAVRAEQAAVERLLLTLPVYTVKLYFEACLRTQLTTHLEEGAGNTVPQLTQLFVTETQLNTAAAAACGCLWCALWCRCLCRTAAV